VPIFIAMMIQDLEETAICYNFLKLEHILLLSILILVVVESLICP